MNITLELDFDEGSIHEVLDIDWHTCSDGVIKADVSGDADQIITQSIGKISLSESSGHDAVAIAIERSVGEQIWKKNLREAINEKEELIEFDA